MTLALELPAGSQSVAMMATPFAPYAAQPFAPRPPPQLYSTSLQLTSQGGRLCFSQNAYTPALHNAMSRTEFDGLLAQLNEVCKQHAPNTKAAMLIPFLGGSMLAQKLNRLRGEISSVCTNISKENRKRGLTLRVVDLDDGSHQQAGSERRRRKAGTPRFRVDLEVTVLW